MHQSPSDRNEMIIVTIMTVMPAAVRDGKAGIVVLLEKSGNVAHSNLIIVTMLKTRLTSWTSRAE